MNPSEQNLLPNRQEQESYELNDSDRDSDLDATEFLNTDPLYPHAEDAYPPDARRPALSMLRWWQCFCCFCVPCRLLRSRSRCCAVALVVGAFVLVILAGSGAFVYKKIVLEPSYGKSPPWYPSPRGGTARSWADSYGKAAAMVRRMTLPEKVNITTGTGWKMGLAVGTTGPAVHVGFPALSLQDGPLGIRFADNATAFPAGVTVGATWNKALMYERGRAHAQEARGKGLNALLGPCVGPLGRMPAGGRNWEGFGSDPYLQGVAAAATIRGIQSEGVMATVKHFVANEQEHFRQPWEWGLPHALSANIDDRTLHELYAWPFGDAIKAGVSSVMCSYNMVNNSYACGNAKLLNGILKDEMGFQGFVMSDCNTHRLAQRSGVASALAGLDMTMPGDGLRWQNGDSLWGAQLTRSVLNGSVPLDRLNDMVTRIVAAWYQMGQDDASFFDGGNDGPNFSSWTNDRTDVPSPGSPSPQEATEVNQYVDVRGNHSSIARRVAAEGIVLLKNTDDFLPMGADGQSVVKSTSRSEGRAAAGKVKIGVFGEDAGPGKGPNACGDRGCNQGTLGSGWGSGAVEFPYLIPPIDALVAGFDADQVELTQHLRNVPDREAYADLDVCIVFANADAGEGYMSWGGILGDRNNLLLQKGGDDLVYSVADGCGSSNGNGNGRGDVIVVVHAVGPVVMERWADLPNVKAVLHANLPGQESGAALADVLFGRVNPSGRLPYTIGRGLADYGPGGQVMYMPNGVPPQQDFAEGLYIDYRYFDKQGITPRYEFGFGLSYTTFAVGNLTVTERHPKSALPSARPVPAASPPDYDTALPDAQEALFPAGFRRLQKYIYPYLDSVDEIVDHPYPYPEGYRDVQPPSGAGGDEGGNPDLWEPYVTVTVDVRNTGARAGQAVVQLYLAYPDAATTDAANVDFPVKVLRGFEKVQLGASDDASDNVQSVHFDLTRRDLSYWDAKQQNWVMVTDGKYRFLVGQSSRDLPAEGSW